MILVPNFMVKTVLSLIIDDFSSVSSQIFVNFVGEWWVVSQHRITACETIATNFLGFAWKGGNY